MQSARLSVPPQLLNPPRTSLLYLRAFLRLPGELRPTTLQNFSSLAHQSQHQHGLSDSSACSDNNGTTCEPSIGLGFVYGGLYKPDVKSEAAPPRKVAGNPASHDSKNYNASKLDGRTGRLRGQRSLAEGSQLLSSSPTILRDSGRKSGSGERGCLLDRRVELDGIPQEQESQPLQLRSYFRPLHHAPRLSSRPLPDVLHSSPKTRSETKEQCELADETARSIGGDLSNVPKSESDYSLPGVLEPSVPNLNISARSFESTVFSGNSFTTTSAPHPPVTATTSSEAASEAALHSLRANSHTTNSQVSEHPGTKELYDQIFECENSMKELQHRIDHRTLSVARMDAAIQQAKTEGGTENIRLLSLLEKERKKHATILRYSQTMYGKRGALKDWAEKQLVKSYLSIFSQPLDSKDKAGTSSQHRVFITEQPAVEEQAASGSQVHSSLSTPYSIRYHDASSAQPNSGLNRVGNISLHPDTTTSQRNTQVAATDEDRLHINDLVAPKNDMTFSVASLPPGAGASAKDMKIPPQLPMVHKQRSLQPEVKESEIAKPRKREPSTLQDLVTQISGIKSLITEIASPKTSSEPEPSMFEFTEAQKGEQVVSPTLAQNSSGQTTEQQFSHDSIFESDIASRRTKENETSSIQANSFNLSGQPSDQKPSQALFRQALSRNHNGFDARYSPECVKTTRQDQAISSETEVLTSRETTAPSINNRSAVLSISPSILQGQSRDQSVAYEPALTPGPPFQPILPVRPESHVNPDPPVRQDREVSPAALLEELFPEEAQRRYSKLQEEKESHVNVPRLPLPVEEQSTSSLYRTVTVASEESTRKGLRRSMTNKDVMTVLELQSGNISLNADDFRRLTPRGKHMKEWAVRGEFKTVFPRRNPWTLARDPPGHYFIVFSNTASAHAYLDHLVHVQKLARQHTPTSLASPIPPPPGYLINGEDVHALIKDFTLVCPAQTLNVSTYSVGPGFTKFKAQLFERGGYPEIVGEGRAKVPQVLLTMVAGPQPTYYELDDAIGNSGKDRNRPWQLVERRDRIRIIEMDRYARSHLNEKDDGGDYHERVAKLKKPDYGQRWILTFLDVEDAKSFVRCWHQRPLPWRRRKGEEEESSRYGKQITMVEAELLW